MSQANQIIDFEALANWLRACDDVAIISHISPDGDTIGSALALKEALCGMGKRACLLCEDQIPASFKFMRGADEYYADLRSAPFEIKAALFVDVSSADRAGCCLEAEGAPLSAVIDHHATNEGFCKLNAVDGRASAAGVIVAELLDYMGVTFTPAIAEDLYTAISTDTGNFSYRNTDGRSLRAAALCLDAGADPDKISRLMFRQRTVKQIQLLGSALSGMRFYCGGRVTVMTLPLDTMRRFNATKADADDIVNFGIELDGVALTALLREDAPGSVKASLRSVDRFDVSAIAKKYGGGGHVNAAGCTFNCDIDSAAAAFIQDAQALLGVQG